MNQCQLHACDLSNTDQTDAYNVQACSAGGLCIANGVPNLRKRDAQFMQMGCPNHANGVPNSRKWGAQYMQMHRRNAVVHL